MLPQIAAAVKRHEVWSVVLVPVDLHKTFRKAMIPRHVPLHPLAAEAATKAAVR